MATIKVKDNKGAEAGSVKADDTVFKIEPNIFALHQVVRSQLAGARAGVGRRKEALAPEGDRSRPAGDDTRTPVEGRRRCVWSAIDTRQWSTVQQN
jgi:ribosomal protein L4